MRSVHLGRAGLASERHRHAGAIPLDRETFGIQANLDALVGEDLLHRLRDVLVFTCDQTRPHLDDGHPTAEATIHLTEFQSDVTAADHDQMLGEEVDFHHRDIGQERRLLQSWHRRDQRPAADVDENTVAFQHVASNLHAVRADESSVSLIDGDSRRTAQPMFDAAGGVPRDLVFACFDPLHVDPHRAGIDSVLARPPGQMRCIGAGDKSFGGNAAVVHAGATELVALDDRDA